MKILDVKKRNPIARSGSIYHWKVTYENDEGEVKTRNVWASTDNPNVGSLLYSIDEEEGTSYSYEYKQKKHIEGIEIALQAVENKVVAKKTDEIVINVQENTQTSNTSQVFNNILGHIRYGK